MAEVFNPFTLEGKTVLVTGASSGIGRGIAIACSKMGAKVIANGRNKEKLAETKSLCEPEWCYTVIGDLTNLNDLEELVTELPQLDGVVHCAGVGGRVLAKTVVESDIDKFMNINFKAPVLLQAELLRKKKLKKGSSVVFIASLGAESPNIANGLYSASKAALISYAECLMLEVAPRKIRVNCISPAMVWTDLIRDDMVTEEELKADEQRYPLKRYGTPEDVANLAVYLLSDAASWVTGSNYRITGGGKLAINYGKN